MVSTGVLVCASMPVKGKQAIIKRYFFIFNCNNNTNVNPIFFIFPFMNTPKLNLFALTMIVIGLVIGMGVFRTASDAAQASITPFVYFASWVIGGLIALCGALTYAEIGSRFPVTGGYYKIFAECYHPSVAFAINCIILISNAASLSGVALIGSE